MPLTTHIWPTSSVPRLASVTIEWLTLAIIPGKGYPNMLIKVQVVFLNIVLTENWSNKNTKN